MRILHVISALAGGGAEVFAKDLSLALGQEDHVVAIAYISSATDQGNSPEIEENFKRELAAEGITLFELGHKTRRNPLLGAWRLAKAITSFKPDILHAHLGWALLCRSLLPLKLPTVYTHHNMIFKYGRALSAWFDLHVQHYVAICSICEVLLHQRTKRPVTLIRNGISMRRVAPRNPNRGAGPFKVISVGRISDQKNYASVIAIASILKERHGLTANDITFSVCGDGAGLEAMRATSQQHDVADIVTFLGGCADVPQRLAAADLLLMTSIYEGMPITLIEAANAGLPLLATDVGGCSEIVLNGQNGFLFEPDDNGAAAALVENIRRDPELRARLSQSSHTIAREFAMDIVTKKYIGVYQSLCRG